MVRFVKPNDGYPDWFIEKYRKPERFGGKFMGKPRQEYVARIKGMGFDDVCECEFRQQNLHIRQQQRNEYQSECADCRCLVFPHNYIHMCDECAEYAIANTMLVPVDQEFLCNYCL